MDKSHGYVQGHDLLMRPVNWRECPDCRSKKIHKCPGGTCLNPTKEQLKKIQYICEDCLNEF
jgi:hypothetical protein